MGTHFNCLDTSIEVYAVATHFSCLDKWVLTFKIYTFIKQIKIQGCNLNTTKCLTALIGVSVVIRSNTV